MLRDFREKEKIALQQKNVEQIKYGVMFQIVVYVLLVVLTLTINAANVQKVLCQPKMENHAFAQPLIKSLIKIRSFAKVDVLTTKSGEIINVYVSQGIAGGIKDAKDAQITLILLMTNQLVDAPPLTLTLILKRMPVLNVPQIIL